MHYSMLSVLLSLMTFQLPVAANVIVCPLIPRPIVLVPWFVYHICFYLWTQNTFTIRCGCGLFGSVTSQTKVLVLAMPKISVCNLMASQSQAKTTDQSWGLRWRNTDIFLKMWDLSLRAPNYQVSAPFVNYTAPEWERMFCFLEGLIW